MNVRTAHHYSVTMTDAEAIALARDLLAATASAAFVELGFSEPSGSVSVWSKSADDGLSRLVR